MQLSVQKPQAYLDWKDYGGGQSCSWGRIGGDSDTKEMDSRTLRVRRNVWGRRGLGAIQREAGKVVCVCREMEIDRQTDRQID